METQRVRLTPNEVIQIKQNATAKLNIQCASCELKFKKAVTREGKLVTTFLIKGLEYLFLVDPDTLEVLKYVR